MAALACVTYHEAQMLKRGDSVPHFALRTVGGQPINYSTIWQRKNLILVTLPHADAEYASQLTARLPEFKDRNTECVVTREAMPQIPAPGVVVADRWGEIVFSATADRVSGLPPPEDLLDWIDYIQNRCPECEGEAK